MLPRLRLRSDAMFGSSMPDVTDGVRASAMSRLEEFACIVLNMVDRLLVSEGTSSVEMRTSGTGSPVVHELTVRLSAMDDAEVPTLDVSNEPCRRAKSGEEKADVW